MEVSYGSAASRHNDGRSRFEYFWKRKVFANLQRVAMTPAGVRDGISFPMEQLMRKPHLKQAIVLQLSDSVGDTLLVMLCVVGCAGRQGSYRASTFLRYMQVSISRNLLSLSGTARTKLATGAGNDVRKIGCEDQDRQVVDPGVCLDLLSMFRLQAHWQTSALTLPDPYCAFASARGAAN